MINLADSPSYFAYRYLGLTLYSWQIETLEAIAAGKKTALRAANGSGKTAAVIAVAILWFLWRHPKGRCAVTSGSWMQVESQLWPAMERFKNLPIFKGWKWNHCHISTPQGGFAIGFSTVNAGRAEGWHGRPGAPVFYVVDEAKTVGEGIFTAIDRCTLQYQLYASSPGEAAGQFYRCFYDEASLFYKVHVTAFDCPHITKERIDRVLTKWGEDHWLTRSMIYGEFTADSDMLVLQPGNLIKALKMPPSKQLNGHKTVFMDVAAGRDENVIAVRDGNYVWIEEAWHDRDTVQAVRRAIEIFKRIGVHDCDVWVDAPGLGIAMINDFREEGWYVNEFWGGSQPEDQERYVSLIAEVWFNGAVDITQGRIRLDKVDPVTFRQLTTRRMEYAGRGKVRVEEKEKMAERGLKSPDRADAILGAIWTGTAMSGVWTGEGTAPEVGEAVYQPEVYAFDTPI